jgi:tetratricopeptide (TPR) repeat protein
VYGTIKNYVFSKQTCFVAMINNRNKTEIIERYLQGELEDDMLIMFREKIETDSEFKREVEVQQLMLQNIKRTGRHELKQYLKEIHKDVQDSGAIEKENQLRHTVNYERAEKPGLILQNSRNKLFFLKVAATSSVVIIAITLWYAATISTQQMYTEKFISYQIPLTRGSAHDQDYVKRFYVVNDFNGYIQHYETDTDRSIHEIFLAGNAYLNLSQPKEAIISFTEVVKRNADLSIKERRFSEDAEFYLGLAYLNAGMLYEAEKIFNSIHKQPGHAYHNRIGSLFLFKLWILKVKRNLR